MARRKAGLHKELSAILDGVPIPKRTGAQELFGLPTLDRTDSIPAKPQAPSPQIPPTPKPQQSVETTPTPEPQPPAWSLSKAIPPKAADKLRQQQAKADGIIKIFRQIPWQIFHSRAARQEDTGWRL